VDRVSDSCWTGEAHGVHAVKGNKGARKEARIRSQPERESHAHGERQHAVGNPSLERRLRRVFHVRVQGMPVPSEAGEIHDIRFGDRSRRRDELFTDAVIVQVFIIFRYVFILVCLSYQFFQIPNNSRAMIRRRISEVPAPISSSFASLKKRCTGYSSM